MEVTQALIELRKLVEELGIKTKSSAGENAHFYAYLHEENGMPADGLFIFVREEQFMWSRTGRHPITDVSGAAQAIARAIFGEQT